MEKSKDQESIKNKAVKFLTLKEIVRTGINKVSKKRFQYIN